MQWTLGQMPSNVQASSGEKNFMAPPMERNYIASAVEDSNRVDFSVVIQKRY
jgi:hypothetical protein